MSDLISRQAAVERFDCIRPCDPMTSDYTHGIDVGIALCKVAIREQPPAQPEPAQWVQMLINPRMYRCSNCNIAWNKRLVFDLDNGNEMVMKYCPCCGKKMLAEVDYE